MKTRWDESVACSGFEAYRDLPEQILGYRFVLRALQPYLKETILDYGCGPGKVSLRLARGGAQRVLAVDTSPAMLDIARSRRFHDAIEYRLIEDGNLGFLDDGSVAAALTCFVFINIGSDQSIERIIREIYRVLRKGAPYLIVDTNPQSTGIEFSTFRNGEKRAYAYGEEKTEVLRLPGGDDLILHDYYWPQEMYHRMLREAGFQRIEQWEPTLQEIPRNELDAFEAEHGPVDWKEEWSSSPFILFRADK